MEKIVKKTHPNVIKHKYWLLTDSVLTVQLIMLHTFARRYYLVLNKAMSDAFISYNLNFMSALYNNNNNKHLSNHMIYMWKQFGQTTRI